MSVLPRSVQLIMFFFSSSYSVCNVFFLLSAIAVSAPLSPRFSTFGVPVAAAIANMRRSVSPTPDSVFPLPFPPFFRSWTFFENMTGWEVRPNGMSSTV